MVRLPRHERFVIFIFLGRGHDRAGHEGRRRAEVARPVERAGRDFEKRLRHSLSRAHVAAFASVIEPRPGEGLGGCSEGARASMVNQVATVLCSHSLAPIYCWYYWRLGLLLPDGCSQLLQQWYAPAASRWPSWAQRLLKCARAISSEQMQTLMRGFARLAASSRARRGLAVEARRKMKVKSG